MSAQQVDCPICMDCIETSKNCVTTECGHCFHTNCLMQSVATNGFGCPYCRTVMAQVTDDESTVYPGEEDEDEYDEEIDEDTMRGFRLFWNNVLGEEQDREDTEEEEAYQVSLQEEEGQEEEDRDEDAPSTEFVANKLREQGVTFEKLISMICHLDHEEYNDDESAELFSNQLFGKIRSIISNYTPEEDNDESPTISQEDVAQSPAINHESQPKIYQRRMMFHV
jgi:hypothetical protein